MFTYQVRPRRFKHDPGTNLTFPNDCIVRFHFEPAQPFGADAGGGRTTVQSQPATAYFNANTGAHTITSSNPLEPLDVRIEDPIRIVNLKGTVLEIAQHFYSLNEIGELIQGLYFVMPVLLNVEFGDPPHVARVDGLIGDTQFRWELADWRMQYTVINQESQEKSVCDSWLRIDIFSDQKNRRLLAALHYFHSQCGCHDREAQRESS